MDARRMVTLSVDDYKEIIESAWERYLQRGRDDFFVVLGDQPRIRVDVKLREQEGHQFYDAGIPGYDMVNNDVPAITAWVRDHITRPNDGPQGGRGAVTGVKDGQVRVYYVDTVMFNFHISLRDI